MATALLDLARFVIAPLLAALVGGVVVHVASRRRDRENEQRRQRLDYLVSAYRTIARATSRPLRGERGEGFEDALSDVVLLGTDEQIGLATKVMTMLASSGEAPLNELLLSMRRDLRAELDLPGDGLRHVPYLRVTWPEEGERSSLQPEGGWVANFDELAKMTRSVWRRAQTGGPTISDGRPGEPEPPNGESLVDELSDLASQAPGAAVATAYARVEQALRDLVAPHEARLDAPPLTLGRELAEAAQELGLVNGELVDAVRGLALLADLSHAGGAGTGLSPQRAVDYLRLADGVLYVMRRPQRQG